MEDTNYVDKRFTDLEKLLSLQLAELEKRLLVILDAKGTALTVASAALEKRLEGMNEFRAQLKEERGLLVSRNEYLPQHDKLVEDIRILRESKAMLEGKASQNSVNIAYIISGVSIVLSLLSLLLK